MSSDKDLKTQILTTQKKKEQSEHNIKQSKKKMDYQKKVAIIVSVVVVVVLLALGLGLGFGIPKAISNEISNIPNNSATNIPSLELAPANKS